MEYFGTSLTDYGHYTWELREKGIYKIGLLPKTPFNPESLTQDLPKGSVAFYQGGGYTVIAISGSPKDERGGTKSVFWLKEIISKEEMIDRIKNNSMAMEIIERMPFEVRW